MERIFSSTPAKSPKCHGSCFVHSTLIPGSQNLVINWLNPKRIANFKDHEIFGKRYVIFKKLKEVSLLSSSDIYISMDGQSFLINLVPIFKWKGASGETATGMLANYIIAQKSNKRMSAIVSEQVSNYHMTKERMSFQRGKQKNWPSRSQSIKLRHSPFIYNRNSIWQCQKRR